jgi:hypothetical protein
MPKVEVVSVWLRWAVDPASALRVLPLLALPTHFLLPFLRLSLSKEWATPSHFSSSPTPHLPRSASPQGALVRPELVSVTQLYLKGPGDLALLVYCVAFSFLRLVLSHTLFPALARK